MTVTEWPATMESVASALLRPADRLLATDQWSAAIEAYQNAYQFIRNNQPLGVRYHKGYPLHNLGIALLWNGNVEAARTHFLEAYIEDTLTYRTPAVLEMPAARALMGLFSITPDGLRAVSDKIERQSGASDVDTRDPQLLFAALKLSDRFPQETVPRLEPAKRRPGMFASPWEQRVFVGGSYRAQVAAIHRIGQVCQAAGFDPVIEFQFEVPEALIHHHALMLLHECRLAIFEVSTDAGQLMELERCRDYSIEPLVLFQGVGEHGSVSAMVATLLSRLNLNPVKYSTLEELDLLILNYLRVH